MKNNLRKETDNWNICSNKTISISMSKRESGHLPTNDKNSKSTSESIPSKPPKTLYSNSSYSKRNKCKDKLSHSLYNTTKSSTRSKINMKIKNNYSTWLIIYHLKMTNSETI